MVSQSKMLMATLAALGILFTAPVSAQGADMAACEDLRREINHYSDLYLQRGPASANASVEKAACQRDRTL